jgi:hypothetical protein
MFFTNPIPDGIGSTFIIVMSRLYYVFMDHILWIISINTCHRHQSRYLAAKATRNSRGFPDVSSDQDTDPLESKEAKIFVGQLDELKVTGRQLDVLYYLNFKVETIKY